MLLYLFIKISSSLSTVHWKDITLLHFIFRRRIQEINWRRKQEQTTAGKKLAELEETWVGLVGKNYEIEQAILELERNLGLDTMGQSNSWLLPCFQCKKQTLHAISHMVCIHLFGSYWNYSHETRFLALIFTGIPPHNLRWHITRIFVLLTFKEVLFIEWHRISSRLEG